MTTKQLNAALHCPYKYIRTDAVAVNANCSECSKIVPENQQLNTLIAVNAATIAITTAVHKNAVKK